MAKLDPAKVLFGPLAGGTFYTKGKTKGRFV